MNGLSHSVINKIKKAVKRTNPTAITILYGSRATYSAKEGSDWDILILLNQPHVSLKEEQDFRHQLYNVELATGQAISTFVYAKPEWEGKFSITPLYREVELKGIVL